MTRLQESSEFLTRINIIPVDEMMGAKVGVGVTGYDCQHGGHHRRR
jgi:hypothetical protein